MNRAIFLVAAVIMIFGLYHCAGIKPKDTKYHALLVAEINNIHQRHNPLCQDLSSVQDFPHVAALRSQRYGAENAEPQPYDPLRVKWRDLVEAGLLQEAPKLDLDLQVVGFEYELTSKGREFYSPLTLPSGETRARFCLGQPVLKEITAIGKPVYSIQGLNVTAEYVMQVENGGPELYDGTAQALGIKAPTRNETGAIVYPPQRTTFVFNRDTGALVDWMHQPMR